MNTVNRQNPAKPSRRGLFALVAGLVLVAGAIGALALTRNSDQEDVAVDVGLTTTTSSPGVDPLTSTSAATTTTSSTTIAETTTTATPPESFEYPNIGNVAFYDGLALGWYSDGRWIEMPTGPDSDSLGPPNFDGATIRYVGQDGATVTRQAGSLGEECTEFGNMWSVGNADSSDGLIGTSGDWELRPRPVQEIGIDDAHRQSVREIVAAAGVADPEIVIQRVVRMDIDGDGTNEVLISAENIRSSNPDGFSDLLGQPEGAYSMVLLRRVTPTGVETKVLSSYVVTAELADPESDFSGFISYSRLVDVADLDGDGAFEAVISSGYYEGSSVHLYELGEPPSNPVAAGCGV
ncbi:MAG: hypothetical protein HKN03_03055 [Acidimicrobiales bacterium]|nr:hypothetical protein [Acidimicrobiales bacterium]